ncbi:MAG: hypothetical protein FH753_04840 [Firmicutes bacterium]|nr:hypothetical protein [Bacillota bacterium]
MREEIHELKKAVSDLESYVNIYNKEKINEIVQRIIDISSSINNKVNDNNEIENDNFEEISYLTTVPFLYKPVTKKDYYEGDYLETFSMQRTDELKRANTLDLHNKFWNSNCVENGNIFGSVPEELLSKDSVDSLLSSGWLSVDVNIYEVNDNIDYFDLENLCENNFTNFLIVTERKEDKYLILEYKI